MLLAIDTSAAASAALVDDDGTVIADWHHAGSRRHAELLTPAIADLTADRAQPITGVIVGIGPGPYTGLRVGIAAGIATALAADVPVHGLLSADALALSAAVPGPLTVAADARRREVYVSQYSGLDADGLPVRSGPPEVLAPAVLAERELGERVGRGFALHAEVLGAPSRDDEELLDPRAADLGRLAALRLARGEELLAPRPEYLRRPDAVVPPERSQRLS